MQQRKDEILAKKAKLAELKRQRELRQKEFSANRQSIGGAPEASPSPKRSDNRAELDSLISSLVGEDRGGPPSPGTPGSARAGRSRPSSYASPARTSDIEATDDGDVSTTSRGPSVPQILSFAPLKTLYEIKSDPPKTEVITYSKGVQTSQPWSYDRSPVESDDEIDRPGSSERPPRRRLSRRQREREEELRQNIRKEIEDELKSLQQPQTDGKPSDETKQRENFPARALNAEELDAVTSSNDFLDFVERSSKVIERALDEEYDVLADYRHRNLNGLGDEDEEYGEQGRKGRRVREVIQFYDERWSKKRIISDISFSPKFPELVLASYTKNPSAPYDPDGLIQVWNMHMHDRPEYIFHATSDILSAKFSPFHPNLVLGSSYSGQVLLWDTRSRSPHPVQRTPLTGSGHTHPIYALSVVGTQNAHNVISTSTDGVLCSWSVDMLSTPQEYLELSAPPVLPTSSSTTSTPTLTRPTDEIAPLATAFPASDPTYLLLGTESGAIHLAHRYDRAGARSGIDARILYAGHQAPVLSLDFHRPTGPLDLGDLVLSAGLDWSIKLWRIRTPAASSIGADRVDVVPPLLDIPRDDAVYDVKWNPARPGVFAAVDGAGALEVWDLTRDTEVPQARAFPALRDPLLPRQPLASNARTPGARPPAGRALNKVAWEPHEGRRLAAGGLDGVLSVWEVGADLGGAENAKPEEWSRMKKLVQRLESK